MADFTTEAFTLLAVGILLIFLRTYARITTVGFRGLKADDYIMLLAMVVYALETAAAYSVGARFHGLANNGMTDAEREALDPSSNEYALRVGGSKLQVAGWSLYTLLLWLLKLAMNIFYIRLTEGVDNMTVRIRIGLVAVGASYLAVILSILFGCHPLYKNWQINPDPGNYCQPAISKIDIYVTVVLNVVTDMYLLSIPLPMLWKANLPRRRKALLLVMFGGGIFVTMAGILRCVLILTNPVTGAQEAGSWAVRETFVAVVTSNIPMIYPLLRRWSSTFMSSPILSTLPFSTGKASQKLSNGDNSHHTYELENKHGNRRAPRSVNPITIGTFAESEEYMVSRKNSFSHANTEFDGKRSNSGGRRSAEKALGGKKGISVTVETEVDSVRVAQPASPREDLYNHYPDGVKSGQGYSVFVTR